MGAQNIATGAAPPAATSTCRTVSGENGRKRITQARLGHLTPEGIARVTGVAPHMPLSDELHHVTPKGLLARLACNGWRVR